MLIFDFLQYRIRKRYTIFCDGYIPSILAIFAFGLIVIGKLLPIIDGLAYLFHHLTVIQQIKLIVFDVISTLFVFSWLLIWLLFIIWRNWNFKAGYTHQDILELLAGQSGLGDRKEYNDSNAVIVASPQDIFITDDPSKCKAILRIAEGSRFDEVYWLKPSHENTPTPNHMPPGIPPGLTPVDMPRPPVVFQENPYYGRYFKKGPYSKVSFDESGGAAAPPPPAVHATVQGSPSAVRPRTSGSYIRFNDENAYDPVTTFGTMPRGPDKGRKRIQYVPQAVEYGTYQPHPAHASSVPVQPIVASTSYDAPSAAYAIVQKVPQQQRTVQLL